MITITSANQLKLNSGTCLDIDGLSDRELGIRALIGYHHYYSIGVFDATALVKETLKNAGLNYHAGYGDQMPANAIKVGQVRVRSGDHAYQLFVYPA